MKKNITIEFKEWFGNPEIPSQNKDYETTGEFYKFFNIVAEANELAPNCPKCNTPMSLRQRKDNGQKFWGCSKWGSTGCKGYVPYNSGVAASKAAQAPQPPQSNYGNEQPTGPAPMCPDCNIPMTLKRGKFGSFYGCPNYNKGCKKTVNVSSQTQQTNQQSNQQNNEDEDGFNNPQAIERTWYVADVLNDAYDLKKGQKVGIAKAIDGNWDFIVLDADEDHGTIPNAEITSVVKSIKDANGKPIQSKNLDELISKYPSPPRQKSKLIETPTEEQTNIEKRFAELIDESDQSHMMISALAGTGKTSMLRHLAWKYWKPGKKWLYIVFNKKNEVEAKDKFPQGSGFEVRTSHSFLGTLLNDKSNIGRIPTTDRVVKIAPSKDEYVEKTRMVADDIAFKEEMEKLHIPTKESDSDDEYVVNAVNSVTAKMRKEYKEQVFKMVGLIKNYALDPRDKTKFNNGVTKILGEHDFETTMPDSRKKIDSYKSDNFREKVLNELQHMLGYDVMTKDFKEEIKQGAIWLVEKTMPHAIDQKHINIVSHQSSQKHVDEDGNPTKNEKGRDNYEHNLGKFRDFDDDLWFAAIHADQIKWPHYDVVLADEVQDFNESQKIMLKKLAEAGAKIIAVGDVNQCVIEGTKISTKEGDVLVQDIKVGQKVLAAMGKGRIVESTVQDVFSRKVTNIPVIEIKTNSGHTIATTPEHTHFAGYINSENTNNKNINFNIILCGDYKYKGSHHYSITGPNLVDHSIITNKHVTKSAQGWKCEGSACMKTIYEMAQHAHDTIGATIIEKAALSKNTLPFIPASHVLPGMTIFVRHNNKIIEDTVKSVETINYSGTVYDLNIERFHNFIADNVVTHNSLYRFRGADGRAFDNVASTLESISKNKNVKFGLTKNFRSRKAIIDASNELTHVKNLQGRNFKDGKEGTATMFETRYDDSIARLKTEKEKTGKISQTAYLSRTNEPLVHVAMKLLANKVPFIILGKDIAKDIKKHIFKMCDEKPRLKDTDLASALQSRLQGYLDAEIKTHDDKSAKSSYLKTIKETTQAVLGALDQFFEEADNSGATIEKFRKWIMARLKGFEVQEKEEDLKAFKERIKKERRNNGSDPVILSTVHKSKGLEFSIVNLLRWDLFPHPKANKERIEDMQQEENAKYVGITRAKDEMHILKLEGQPGYKGGSGKEDDDVEDDGPDY